jgi:hypothetical protein
VTFRYDERSNPLSALDDKYQGTKVAGHPVLLTLLVGDDSRAARASRTSRSLPLAMTRASPIVARILPEPTDGGASRYACHSP